MEKEAKKIRKKMTFYTVLFNLFTVFFICGISFFSVGQQITFRLFLVWILLAIIMLQFQLDLSCRLFDLIFEDNGDKNEGGDDEKECSLYERL